jgi:hypothetical protein
MVKTDLISYVDGDNQSVIRVCGEPSGNLLEAAVYRFTQIEQ